MGIKRGLSRTGRSAYFGFFDDNEVVTQNGKTEREPIVLVEGGYGPVVVGAYQNGLSPDPNRTGMYLGVRFGSRAVGAGLNIPAAVPEAYLTEEQRMVWLTPDF
jgi:hypothetical protein